MSIVVNIYYSGENGSARKFAKEMISSGTVDAIRNEAGNIRYDYFFPLGDEETVLLIDSWENQESIDFHHQTPMMNKIAELRDKYNLHMKVERYQSEDTIPDKDQKYIRNWQLQVWRIEKIESYKGKIKWVQKKQLAHHLLPYLF